MDTTSSIIHSGVDAPAAGRLSRGGRVPGAVGGGAVQFYVVTAVDAADNESARSDEAEALPHLVIGWANLQSARSPDPSPSKRLPLPDASVDCAFLITVLPEIPDPVRGLREVYRVLKPGGVFSTTEEFMDPDYPRRKTTIDWATAAGFEPAESYGNCLLYTLNFRKPV